MNPMATSKEEILKTSRVLIQQNGWEAVNIRAVAAACGVSVGCIYNYFGSKTELVSAAVESIWSDIFRHPDDPAVFEDTLSCIRWMYRQMEYGSEQYPGFFTHHALGFVRQDTADGKQQMRQTWQHILDALTMVLTSAAPTLPLRVLAVIGAVLGGYVLVQPLLNRVARRLVMMAADHQVDRPTLRRELTLSQEQLARMLSLSRQTVNEVLAGLEADGLIRRRRRVIELLDPDRLHKDGAEPGDAPGEIDVDPVDKSVDRV